MPPNRHFLVWPFSAASRLVKGLSSLAGGGGASIVVECDSMLFLNIGRGGCQFSFLSVFSMSRRISQAMYPERLRPSLKACWSRVGNSHLGTVTENALVVFLAGFDFFISPPGRY